MSKRHLLAALLVAGSFGATSIVAQSAKKVAQPAAKPAPKPAERPPAPSAAELVAPPASAAKLPSGVSTQRLRAGKGADSPRPQDFVAFRSLSRRSDGSVIADGFGTKEPTRLVLSKLNRGWQEGLSGMTVGEQRRFWFPAELMPIDKVSGKKEPVVFDIELVSIFPVPDAPASLKTPDARAVKAGAGTSVLTVKAGKAGKAAARTDAALVNFTLWNPAGQVVGSSAVDGRPTLFPLDKVMPSFADCLLGMKVSERRQCWIPALHNDGFPGAPKGDLIFDVELLQFIDLAELAGQLEAAQKNPPAGKPPGN